MQYNHTIIGQVLSIIPKNKFQQIVDKYNGDYRVRKLTCWNQFVSLFYGQLRQRDTLRGIESGLITQQQKLYHLGINPIKRSTLSDANNLRDYRIYEESFYMLLGMCQQLTQNKVGFKNPIYSLDATVINLCYSLFPWAKYRTRKGAIKMHVLLEHENYLPEFIMITEGNQHELNLGKQMPIKPDSILVIDRGYYDFEWLYSLHKQNTTFVIRAKKDLSYTLIGQHEITGDDSNVIADEDILVPWKTSKYESKQRKYPEPIRMVTYIDPETGKVLRFLTNNEDFSPETIALIYKQRWQIELFFKWIKQNLKIKSFLGTSKNAVFTQIWIAMIVYLLIWYIKFQSKYKHSMLHLTRILNEGAFERVSIINILSQKFFMIPKDAACQLNLEFSGFMPN